jgi:hypothetical protein
MDQDKCQNVAHMRRRLSVCIFYLRTPLSETREPSVSLTPVSPMGEKALKARRTQARAKKKGNAVTTDARTSTTPVTTVTTGTSETAIESDAIATDSSKAKASVPFKAVTQICGMWHTFHHVLSHPS